MGLSPDFIEKLGRPRCPYCAGAMDEHHAKTWLGRGWHYLAIEFSCNGSAGVPPHQVVIRARTEAEWAQHAAQLLVCHTRRTRAVAS